MCGSCCDGIAIIDHMASLNIRRLDDQVKSQLRMLAASHGRSMEEEAREILKSGLTANRLPQLNLAEAMRRHIVPLGGVELKIRPRRPVRRPPDFTN